MTVEKNSEKTELERVAEELQRDPSCEKPWSRFFTLVWPQLLLVSNRFARSYNLGVDAEDIGQEVLVKLSQGLHAGKIELGAERSIRSLLSVIARRLAIDKSRSRRSRQPNVQSAEYFERLPSREISDYGIGNLEWLELFELVNSRLTEDESEILSHKLEQATNEEIALILGYSVRTVERKVKRIIEQVRLAQDLG